MEQEWVGIQFNLMDDTSIKLRPSLKAMGMETDGEHLTIKFSRKEIKKMDIRKNPEKLRIAIAIIRKYLASSDYTNIYTYFDADRLSNIKKELEKGMFKEAYQIQLKEIKDKQNYLNNFRHLITHQSLLNLIKKHPLMQFMNELLKEVATRNYAVEQELTLTLVYEDKYELGADRDNINVSMQLEIPRVN